jgi:hypothetical protein
MKRQTKKRFQFQAIPDVRQLGFFRPLAQSRPRLLLAGLLSMVLLYSASFATNEYINHRSSSISINFLIITFLTFFVMISSYVLAMMVSDLVFPYFRERYLLGSKIEIDNESAEAVSLEQHKDYNIHFFVLAVVLTVANYVGTRAATGDYMGRYQEFGFHLARLRSGEPELQAAALKKLAAPELQERWYDPELKAMLLLQLDSPDPEVQGWALYLMGLARFEEAFPKMLQKLHEGPVEVRARAAEALGSTADGRAIEPLRAALDPKADPRIIEGVVRGLVRLKDDGAAASLVPLLAHPSERVQAHASWGLGLLKHEPARPLLWARYDTAKNDVERCAALEGLKYLAKPEDAPRAKKLFLTLTPDPECAGITWDEPVATPTQVVVKESLRAKLVKIVANGSGAAELDWFAFVTQDQAHPFSLRELAGTIYHHYKP